MESLEKQLKDDAAKVINTLTANKKNIKKIEELKKEYKLHDRTIRDSQVGNIQKDKIVGEGEKLKVVPAIRIPIPFQKRIVRIATAFEVGEPVTITPVKESDLSEEILHLWESNRLDDKLKKAKVIQKSETEVALEFYINDLKPNNLFNRLLGVNKNRNIKSKILSSKGGKMTPYFVDDDMKSFVWEYSTIDDNKTINYVRIYDEKNVYKCSDESGTMKLIEVKAHGFSIIPIVYMDQEVPEWDEVEKMIDRLETSMSKLGGSNDYSGYPLLKLYGEVTNMPNRDDDGKTLVFPMKETYEGKTLNGDAEFLTNSNAPESVKLELDRLEDYIYAISSTPNISFNNLKGVGQVSGIALKFMFLDAIIKAKMNEGDNRTAIQRMLNVLISGTITTTVVKFDKQAKDLLFKIQFNSILPDDLSETVTTLSTAVNSKLMSRKTAVGILDYAENDNEELEAIKKDDVVV